MENVDEISHDVRENGDTGEEYDGTEQTLRVASRVEVAKADGRQCSECIVDHEDRLFVDGVVIDAELQDETVVLAILIGWQKRELTENVPDHTDVVADGEDDEHEAYRPEAVADDKNRVNVVVTRLLVLSLFLVGLDKMLEPPLEHILDCSHELA